MRLPMMFRSYIPLVPTKASGDQNFPCPRNLACTNTLNEAWEIDVDEEGLYQETNT